jgi:outer membrane protein
MDSTTGMRPASSFVIAGGLAAALCGFGAATSCAQPPPTQEPPASQQAADSTRRTYDLKLAIETALRENPALAAAAARMRAAKTGIEVAGAEYRPVVEGRAGLSGTLAGENTVVFGDGFVARGLDANPLYGASLSLVVPVVREGGLTLGKTTLPSVDAARFRYDTIRHEQDVARSEIVGNVAVAFFTALAARGELAVAGRLVELNQVLYDNARARFEQQLTPSADVLAAESSLITARADLEIARSALTTSVQAFVAALGLDPSIARMQEIELVDRDDPMQPLEPLDDLLQQMISRHPVIRAQEAKLKEATARLERARTDRYPTLDAVMTIGAADDFSFSFEDWAWRAGLRLNWRLFDFGILNLKIKEQSEVVEAEKRVIGQLKNQLSQPVIRAYRNLTASRARIAPAAKLVELTEELARAAHERFQQNLVSTADVLRAEVSLANARKALILARANARLDRALLHVALGTE